MERTEDRRVVTVGEWLKAKGAGEDVEHLVATKAYHAEVKADGEGEDRTLRFTISTQDVDRDGDTLAVEGWELDRYKSDPVVLWAHQYQALPVAKSLSVEAGDGRLTSVAEFATRELYAFADTVYQMYLKGFLSAVSVGFIPKRWENVDSDARWGWDILEQELLEYSAVPVPSNPNALVEARAKGIDLDPLMEWAERTLDGVDGGDGTRLLIPRKMVEVVRKIADGRYLVVTHFDGEDGDGKPVESGVSLYPAGSVKDGEDPPDLPGPEGVEIPESDEEGEMQKCGGPTEGIVDVRGGSAPEAEPRATAKQPIQSHSTATSDAEWTVDPPYSSRVRTGEDVPYYSALYAWRDPDIDPALKMAWKFLHHECNMDGDPGAANVRQCANRIGVLNGGRGGTTIPDTDRKGVWNHLARHMRDAGAEPPELLEQQASVGEWAEKHLDAYRRLGIDPDVEFAERRAKTAFAPHKTPTTEEWEETALYRRRVRKGEERAYYARIFAWYDPEGEEGNKGTYKGIHHVVDEDGNPGAASVIACRDKIAILNGARGGFDIPEEDREPVYRHVAKHLRDAGVEPPELKSLGDQPGDADPPAVDAQSPGCDAGKDMGRKQEGDVFDAVMALTDAVDAVADKVGMIYDLLVEAAESSGGGVSEGGDGDGEGVRPLADAGDVESKFTLGEDVVAELPAILERAVKREKEAQSVADTGRLPREV